MSDGSQFRDIIQMQWPSWFVPGCLPRTDEPGDTFRMADPQRVVTYPRDKWPELARTNRSFGRLAVRVYNQGSLGQCSYAASVAGWWLQAIMQFGRDALPPDGLAATVPYQETVRSPSQGVALNVALRKFQTDGTLPLDTPANREWLRDRDIDPSHVAPEARFGFTLPRGCESTREHFRPRDASDLPDYESIIAAAADNKPAIYGSDAHAKCVIDFEELLIDYINSWGKWGLPLRDNLPYGRGQETERNLSWQVSRYGAWCIEAVYESPLFRQV